MIMTVQQEFYLKTLRTFGCLRADQLLSLMQQRFHIQGAQDVNEVHMAAILRQLRYGNHDIRQSGNFIGLANATPDSRILEAIDVMLELSETAPTDLRCGEEPILVKFAVQSEKLRLFTVAWLHPSMAFDCLERHKMERIIWLSESGTPPQNMVLPHKHFFAVRQKDGSHRFFGSTEPTKNTFSGG